MGDYIGDYKWSSVIIVIMNDYGDYRWLYCRRLYYLIITNVYSDIMKSGIAQ